MSTIIDSFDSDISGWEVFGNLNNSNGALPSSLTWDSLGGLGTMKIESLNGTNILAYRTIDSSMFNKKVRINFAKIESNDLMANDVVIFIQFYKDGVEYYTPLPYNWPNSPGNITTTSLAQKPNMSLNQDGTISGYIEFDFNVDDLSATYELHIGQYIQGQGDFSHRWMNTYIDSIEYYSTEEQYSLSANLDSANEGTPVTITLQTTNVDENEVVPFTIGGSSITLEDFVNLDSLGAGQFTVGSDGTATFNLEINSDSTTEGPETFTVTLDDHPEVFVNVDINDISLSSPQSGMYQSISVSESSITEGTAVTFTLNGSNMTQGSPTGFWEISDASPNLSFDTELSGNFNITSDSQQEITSIIPSDNSTYQGGQNSEFKLSAQIGNEILLSPNVLVLDDESAGIPNLSTNLVWDEVEQIYRGVFDIDENGDSQVFTFDLEKYEGNVSVELQGIDPQFPNTKNSINVTSCDIFRLTSTANSVVEGNSFTINFYTNVGAGEYPYKITGVSANDIDVPLVGTFIVGLDEASLTVTTSDHGLDEGIEKFVLTLDNGKAFVEVNIIDRYYTMFSAPEIEINENQILRVELNTNGNDGLYDYNIVSAGSPGFSSADFSNFSLEGSFDVQNGTGQIFIPIKRDYLTEGDEYFRVSLDNGRASVDIKINDTSETPMYYLQSNKLQVNEGEPVVITLSVEGDVPIGTDLPYTISVDGNEGIDFIGNAISVPESIYRNNISNDSNLFQGLDTSFGTYEDSQFPVNRLSTALSGDSKVLSIGCSGSLNSENDYSLNSINGEIYQYSDQVIISDFDSNNNSWQKRINNITSPFNLKIERGDLSEYQDRGKYSLFWGRSVSLSADGNTLAVSSTGYPKIKSDWDGSDNVQSAIDNIGENGIFGSSQYNTIDVQDMGFGAIFFYDWNDIGQEWVRRGEWISGTLGSLSLLNYWESESRGGHWFEFGNSISLSGDGRYLAVGCPGFSVTDLSNPYASRSQYQSEIGMVQVFRKNPNVNNGWELIEEELPYNSLNNYSFGGFRLGSSVSFSSDGKYLAVGEEGYKSNNQNNQYPIANEREGQVRIYKDLNAHRIITKPIDQYLDAIGNPVDYDVSNYFGSDVSFDDNGTRLLVGSKLRDVQLYEGSSTLNSDWGGIYVYERDYDEEDFSKSHLYLYNDFDANVSDVNDKRLLGSNLSLSGDGKKLFTTIRGVSGSTDIIYDNITQDVPSQGIFTVNEQYQDQIKLRPRSDFSTSEGQESFTLALNNNQASSTVSVRDSSILPEYYFLEIDKTVINEGDSVEVQLTTRNILTGEGTEIPFTVSGVFLNDFVNPPLDGNMKGNFVIDADGKASVTFTTSQDLSTLEPHETMTLTLDNGLDSISVVIKDSSNIPTYDLQTSSDSANEGDSVQVTLTTTDVEGQIPYKISGISLDDFVSITNSSGQDIKSQLTEISSNEFTFATNTLNSYKYFKIQPIDPDLDFTAWDNDYMRNLVSQNIQFLDQDGNDILADLGNVSIIYPSSSISGSTEIFYSYDLVGEFNVKEVRILGKIPGINRWAFTAQTNATLPYVELFTVNQPHIPREYSGTSFDVGERGQLETDFITFNIRQDLSIDEPDEIVTVSLDNGQSSVSFTIHDTSNVPTYTLSSSSIVSPDQVDEGKTIIINLKTTDIDPGSLVPFTISGVQLSDFVNPPLDANLKGNFFIGNNETSTVQFEISEDLLDESESFTLMIDGTSDSITVFIVDATFNLSSTADSANEGDSVSITLETTNLSRLTEVPFTISGVSQEDFNNPPFDTFGNGKFILDSNGDSTIDFDIVEDLSTGEPNETLRLTLDNNGQFIDVVINDTSFKPLYELKSTSDTVNEGQEFTITLDTLDVPDGSEVEFIISGVTPDDFDEIN